MTKTIHATFDGEVLRPDEPLAIPANTRVLITITTGPQRARPEGFLETAEGLQLEGPTDWSERLDDYLYGGRDDE